ncbi:hypothetical protein CBR_g49261 [Chara braunii]|uniref:Uncharacterized protein n=1 Tax=Chara braunii TaxID=69332 RepID=A0A388M4G4_CHABU|nr:hypothetical protein CBR_g49261 [Chara braunii]|eukprot:GBG89470.1 hypothetical protein CBR_g49261 [Chara braunii]
MVEKELIKQSKMLALIEEQKANQKQMEEEIKKWEKEQEEKVAAIDAEVEAEAEKEEEWVVEVPLQRNVRMEERGESSMAPKLKAKMEKMATRWVANLALGEEEEASLLVPQGEREAFATELQRQTMEEEKKLEWKFRLTRERRRRLAAAEMIEKALRTAKEQRRQLAAQEDLKQKIQILFQNMDVVLRAQ